VKHWPILLIFGNQHYEATWHRKLSFCPPHLILSPHYYVKFRSHILAVYGNELKLDSTCFGSEITNGTVTNTSNSYYFTKNHTCYIASFLLLCVLKMLPPARIQAVDVDVTCK